MFTHSPRIVTDGLVLYLDAGNTKSYSGSGTVWKDLSGKGNDGTLVNGPTFNSDNLGSIVFDGSNDLADVNNFSITSEYTVNVIISFLGAINGNRAILDYGNLNNAFRLYMQNNKIKVQHDLPFAAAGVFSTFTPSLNLYYNITTTYSGGVSRLYLNSLLDASANLNSPNTTLTRIGIADHPIGSTSGINQLNCSIGVVQIYNRALTSQEILQNYNATKGRFGL